jgi:hypothetical protein
MNCINGNELFFSSEYILIGTNQQKFDDNLYKIFSFISDNGNDEPPIIYCKQRLRLKQ